MRGTITTLALVAVAAALTLAAALTAIPPVLVVALGVVAVLAAFAIFAIPVDQLGFAAVGLLLVVITWNGVRFGGGAIADPLLALAFLAVVAQLLATRRSPLVPVWLVAAAMGFTAAALLNVIFPPNSGLVNDTLLQYRTVAHPLGGTNGYLTAPSNLLVLVQVLIGFILIPLMIAAVATTPRRVDRLVDAWTISGTVNGAVGLVGLLTSGGRAAGLTIHPNYLALTCAMTVPTALLWVNRGGRWRLAGVVAVALILGGEYGSGSRSGAVAALLALVATVAALPRLRRGFGLTLPLAGMAALAVLLFTPTGKSVLSQLRFGGDVKTQISVNGSDTQRSQLHHLALQQFESHPVQGIGFMVIEDAHDIYLQLLAAGGVIALLSFVVFAGGVIDSALRARAGPLRDSAWAAGIAFVVWLANGPFTAQLGDKYLYVVPGLVLAMYYVTETAGAREPAAADPAEVGPQRPLVSAPAR